MKLPSGTVKSWALGNYRPPHSRQDSQDSPQYQTLEESFAILALPMDSEDLEIKKAYRQKVAHFHPDKIRSKDLPKEFTEFANEQLARINQAYKISKNQGVLNDFPIFHLNNTVAHLGQFGVMGD